MLRHPKGPCPHSLCDSGRFIFVSVLSVMVSGGLTPSSVGQMCNLVCERALVEVMRCASALGAESTHSSGRAGAPGLCHIFSVIPALLSSWFTGRWPLEDAKGAVFSGLARYRVRILLFVRFLGF